MKRKSLVNSILLFSPLLLGVVFMLPRLLSAQFGFFDDARGLGIAKSIWSGTWSLGAEAANGRFRPLYTYYNALIYRLVGLRPFWFFTGNLLILLAIIFFLILLVQSLGLGRKAAWVAGFSLVLAGPTLESFYTLNKPETLQALWLLLFVLTSGLYVRIKNRFGKVVVLLLLTTLAFLICITKETGILLIPAALFSYLVTWFWYRMTNRSNHPKVKLRSAMWWSAFFGVLIYLIIASIFMQHNLLTTRSSNFNFTPAWLYSQIRLAGDWMLRDYLFLVPMGMVALIALFRKANRDKLFLLLEFLVWMGLWIGVYIPWIYIPEYYLLPAALITALICALFVSVDLELATWNSPIRYLALVGLVLSGILFVATLPSQVSNGRLQLAIDRANNDMLTYVVKHAPEGGTVWINIQTPNEYVEEITLWVTQIMGRPDLQVDYFHFQDLTQVQENTGKAWIVSPFVNNLSYPSVRMGIMELPSREWNSSLDDYLENRGELLTEIKQSFHSSNFDPIRSFCPLTPSLSYCLVPNAPLDNRILDYGWRIISIP
jgi:hypothetical protein